MTAAAAEPRTRRERIRAQTLEEIKQAARHQLVGHGPGGIQLRAVAREVGLTAPALYRYFPSLEDLVEALTVDLYAELTDAMAAARAAVGTEEPYTGMLALARAFRGWAVAHPAEFGLMFATPPAALGQQPSNACQEASSRFGSLFAEQFLLLWHRYPISHPDGDALVPGLADELLPYWTWLTGAVAPDLPIGAVVRFLEGWVRIYGAVALEVFGHLSWAMPDGGPMFEQSMRGLAETLGIGERYVPPATAPGR